MIKRIRYLVEGIFLWLIMAIFKALPPEKASNLGGVIGRVIGKRLAASRKARKNLKIAFPELSDDEIDNIIIGMWDNLGRVMAEYPHLEYLSLNNTEIHGKELLDKNKARIIIGLHMANWEIPPISFLTQCGFEIDAVYRAPNNPIADKMLMKARSLNGKIVSHPKSKKGTRSLVRRLSSGKSAGILIDQKYNEGLEVNFFGKPAMTSPAAIQLAQKFGISLIYGKIKRINGTKFTIELKEYKNLYDKDMNPRNPSVILSEIHSEFEKWIKESPEQWLWLHRRWK